VVIPRRLEQSESQRHLGAGLCWALIGLSEPPLEGVEAILFAFIFIKPVIQQQRTFVSKIIKWEVAYGKRFRNYIIGR
ncbi:MAG: hypothetical protein IKZ43_01950, partial [Acidaminococcaceae bacterium]|nr:hypothetical protein [Acidaminococcaceae bacterium]